MLRGVNYLFALFLICVAIFLAYIAIPAFGNKALIVRSGSMSPTIKTGDLIVVRIASGITSPLPNAISKYKVEDTIAFKENKNPNVLTTHKIVAKKIVDGKTMYQTKGDANKIPDTQLIAEEQIVGRSILTMPKVGKLFAFAKTKQGFALLVLIPALLVILIESTNLIKELFKISRARRMLQADPKSDIESGNLLGPVGLRVLLPIVISIMFFHNSYAFFSDSATSLNNTFTAASAFPTPTPTPTPTPSPSPSPSSTPIATPSPSPSPQPNLGVVINEVYYRIANAHRINNSEAGSEWIELYNTLSNPLTLQNFSIEDNTSCDNIVGPYNIPANGFAIVSTHTESEFRAVWTTIPTGVVFIQSPTAIGNGLANNDEIQLKNGSCIAGATLDHISWGSNISAFTPSIPMNSNGVSSERNPDGIDTNTASDFIDMTTPTPGT